MSVYEFSVSSIKGDEISLSEYKDKVLLIVNTASKCGFTPQLEGLQSLYGELSEQGVEVLGFPCNQFGKQEPGAESEIEEFCQLNYGVSFPMFSKIEVNGDNASPLYQYLKTKARGVLGSKSIKWNFTKFLINREGEVVKRFAPNDTPEVIRKHIMALV